MLPGCFLHKKEGPFSVTLYNVPYLNQVLFPGPNSGGGYPLSACFSPIGLIRTWPTFRHCPAPRQGVIHQPATPPTSRVLSSDTSFFLCKGRFRVCINITTKSPVSQCLAINELAVVYVSATILGLMPALGTTGWILKLILKRLISGVRKQARG